MRTTTKRHTNRHKQHTTTDTPSCRETENAYMYIYTLNHQVTFQTDEIGKNATTCNRVQLASATTSINATSNCNSVQLANATNSNQAEGAISRGGYLVTSDILQTTVDLPKT